MLETQAIKGHIPSRVRTKYPGGWCQAMNLGRGHEFIFLGSKDYLRLRHVLREESVIWHVKKFHLDNYRSAGSGVSRVKKTLTNDVQLRNRVERVKRESRKAQN